MKAYLLFAGSHYYPSGGVNDFVKDFDSIDDAVTFFEQHNQMAEDYTSDLSHYDWYHVAQSNDMSLVTDSWNGI